MTCFAFCAFIVPLRILDLLMCFQNVILLQILASSLMTRSFFYSTSETLKTMDNGDVRHDTTYLIRVRWIWTLEDSLALE